MTTRALPDLPAGLYRHYKGPLYQAMGYAHDANFPDRDLVLYLGIELDQAHKGPRFAVRTHDRRVYPDHDAWADLMCLEHMCPMQECEAGVNGQHRDPEIGRRFDYRGPQYHGGNQHDAY